jgi:small subunit ribosomal protein S16
MSAKIRLQRHGSKKAPVLLHCRRANSTSRAATASSSRSWVHYNPLTIPATVRIDRERSLYWLQEGAEPTNTVRRIMSFKGVLYLKHLMRGVNLGLFDQAAAMQKFETWNAEHEQLVARREEAHRKHKHEKRQSVMSDSVKRVEEKMAAKAAAAAPAPEEGAAEGETAEANTEAAEA